MFFSLCEILLVAAILVQLISTAYLSDSIASSMAARVISAGTAVTYRAEMTAVIMGVDPDLLSAEIVISIYSSAQDEEPAFSNPPPDNFCPGPSSWTRNNSFRFCGPAAYPKPLPGEDIPEDRGVARRFLFRRYLIRVLGCNLPVSKVAGPSKFGCR